MDALPPSARLRDLADCVTPGLLPGSGTWLTVSHTALLPGSEVWLLFCLSGLPVLTGARAVSVPCTMLHRVVHNMLPGMLHRVAQ